MDFLKKLIRLFYSKTPIRSEKNGDMILKKFFGRIEILYKNYTLCGPIINRIFRTMLQSIPKTLAVNQVLLLGLGAGGATREIRRRFPGCYITAVEYDPEMVHLAKEFNLEPEYRSKLEIMVSDADQALGRLEKKFDLILIDLFIGDRLAPILESADFVERLSKRLESDGYLTINFFRQAASCGAVFDRFFSHWQTLRHSNNQMGVYRHFGNGLAGDPVPEGFVDHKQSIGFLKAMTVKEPSLKLIGVPGAYGLRVQLGPFRVERYVSESEPTIEVGSPGLICWQPLTTTTKSGWFHHPWIRSSSRLGVVVFHDENYWASWSRHAKRHREKWLREPSYEIVSVSFDDFAAGYHASGKRDRGTRNLWLDCLRYYVGRQLDQVHFFVARDWISQDIVAGLAIIDYPDIKQSVHMVSFIHPKAEATSVGTGLIDHSFKHGLAHGISLMNFGVFWQPGDPKSWQSYSNFKTQFRPYFIVYPPPLYQIIWPKIILRLLNKMPPAPKLPQNKL